MTCEIPQGGVAIGVGIWSGELQRDEVIVSCGKVNRLVRTFLFNALPAIYFSHRDLPGRQQRPEQHRRRLCRWQNSLRLDASLELLMQAFDCVGRTDRAPLFLRE